jgi:putative Holliday junction resolvase
MLEKAISPPTDFIPEGTLLAFDFGIKRIGIAMGNTILRHASPLTTLNAERTDAPFEGIARLLDEWRPCALVVGVPWNVDGTPHEITALSLRFAKRLKDRFRLPVILIDERYSSLAAASQLTQQGIHGMKQKGKIDQYAAQEILQAYFNEPLSGKLA